MNKQRRFLEVLEMLEVEENRLVHGEPGVTDEDRREYLACLRRSGFTSKAMEALTKGPGGWTCRA
ncbi:MAG: hypothetical protein JRN59_07805 [Nitrososphaerota archaeon]|nr:hypothetical protein [Nitrososphaerota archaeon]